VEQIEAVELDAPAFGETVAEAAVEDAERRRPERAILGQRPRADIAPAQRADPAGVLAERDAGRGHHPWRVENKIARRIANLRLRETGERLINLLLRRIEAEKAGAGQRQIGIEMRPGHRPII